MNLVGTAEKFCRSSDVNNCPERLGYFFCYNLLEQGIKKGGIYPDKRITGNNQKIDLSRQTAKRVHRHCGSRI